MPGPQVCVGKSFANLTLEKRTFALESLESCSARSPEQEVIVLTLSHQTETVNAFAGAKQTCKQSGTCQSIGIELKSGRQPWFVINKNNGPPSVVGVLSYMCATMLPAFGRGRV